MLSVQDLMLKQETIPVTLSREFSWLYVRFVMKEIKKSSVFYWDSVLSTELTKQIGHREAIVKLAFWEFVPFVIVNLIHSDKGLTIEKSAVQYLHAGQFMLSSQLIY